MGQLILTVLAMIGAGCAGYTLAYWFPIHRPKPYSVTVADCQCNRCGQRWVFKYIDGVHTADDTERDMALVRAHHDLCPKKAAP